MATHDNAGYARPGPLKPLCGINQHNLVLRRTEWVLYRVRAMEALPPSAPLVVNFGAINAVTTTGNLTLQTQMEMDEGQLGHFRFAPLQDLEVVVNQPQSGPRWLDKNSRANFSLLSRVVDPDCAMSEIMVFKDEYPFFTVTNPTNQNYAKSLVALWGFRYHTRQINAYAEPDVDDLMKTYGYVSIVGQNFAAL